MKIHIVKKGDTLYLIGQKYGVSVEELQKLNPTLTNPHNILIGTKVKVPASASKPGAPELIHKYKAKIGDTLWKLSKAWGVSLQELIKANPQIVDPAELKEGDTVHIPKPSASPLTAQHKAEPESGEGGKKNTAPKSPEPAAEKKTVVQAEPVLPPPPVVQVEELVVAVVEKPSYGSMPKEHAMEPLLSEAAKSHAGYTVAGQSHHHAGHEMGEAVHPFMQEKIPATEAFAPLYQMPQLPGSVAGAAGSGFGGHGGYGHYGPTYSQEIPGLAAGAGEGGYGGYGGHGGHGGYGEYQGYGTSPSMGSPYGAEPAHGGYSGYAMHGGHSPFAAAESPYGHGQGHGGYGAGAHGPESAGYGMPYAPYEPQAAGPAEGYAQPGGWPAGASPAASPWGGHHQAYMDPYASASSGGYGYAGGYGGGYGGYGAYPAQPSAAAGGYPMAAEYGASAPWSLGPGGSFSYGGSGTWQPEAALPASAGPAGYGVPAAGGYAQPAWPGATAGLHGAGGYGQPAAAAPAQLSPVQAQPCGCGDREDEAADGESASEPSAAAGGLTVQGPSKPAKTGTAAPRKPAKKAVIRAAARPTVRRPKGSRPWINRR
ncbi:LysM peptidoglycan-binding domain-containing protein [Paenibacillus albicereus]|uniref:LysM peptidoglycan-binding domain-containing protein n=1 Tax=Paenibacillus albicereus TaxID=2726185 RepID=A0A6H2GZP1_9BACL|nr:LysM peptidoglycan-binding domain-containing protein [Paenibacillus albicereus]QJC52875.1 LysM peptidoglycan-binding domain-containing protein [Paenibacillus albicereus]